MEVRKIEEAETARPDAGPEKYALEYLTATILTPFVLLAIWQMMGDASRRALALPAAGMASVVTFYTVLLFHRQLLWVRLVMAPCILLISFLVFGGILILLNVVI